MKIRRFRIGKLKKGVLGESDTKTGVVKINVKAHKGDRRELASTIKHEIMHIKHPKMTEKQVYKRTAKTKISPSEQRALIARLKEGKLRKKLNVGEDEQLAPGALINKAKELSATAKVSVVGLA